MTTRLPRRMLLCISGALAAVLALTLGVALAGADEPVAPRNSIVMIADGAGFNHFAAAARYERGPSDSPLYAQFPIHLAMSTLSNGGAYDPQRAAAEFAYVADGATDSAAAATAMATGVKTYNGAIGVDADKRPIENVLERGEAHGGWEQTLLIVTADHETGYLTGPGSDPRMMPLVSHGEGVQPRMEFHSGSHTNRLLPFFARGADAERFVMAATGSDPVRGAYLDNTDIGRTILGLAPAEPVHAQREPSRAPSVPSPEGVSHQAERCVPASLGAHFSHSSTARFKQLPQTSTPQRGHSWNCSVISAMATCRAPS